MGLKKETKSSKARAKPEAKPEAKPKRQKVVKQVARHPNAPKPEWEKPKRRRKKVEQADAPGQPQARRQRKTHTVAAQYLFRGYGETVNQARLARMVISQDDFDYLISGANAFVFVVKLKEVYLARIAAEKHVIDYPFTGEPEKVIAKLLKQLRDDKFESALVLGDDTIVSIINGRKGDKPMKMTEAQEKAHKAASRQKVSAELRVKQTAENAWQFRQLEQMRSIKGDTHLVYESTKFDGNSLTIWTTTL